MSAGDRDKDVWLLGAGFSHAVSEHMPVLDTLGSKLVGEDLGFIPDQSMELYERFRANFEQLLTYLATDHPWLSEAERLLNQAEFRRLSQAIGAVLGRCQDKAIASVQEPPPWFVTLIERWHERRTTVATFNYDTLIEKVFEIPSGRGGAHGALYLPRVRSVRAGMFAGPKFDTFRLFKLHGSLNWLYSGAESFYGEQILDGGIKPRWTVDGAPPGPLDDGPVEKMSLIVPPTAWKSRFFANEAVRAQWLRTTYMLREAKRVFIVGYSLPESDLIARFLLTTIGKARTVVVVNKVGSERQRDELAARYESAMAFATIDTTYVRTTDVMESFVDDFIAGYVRGEPPAGGGITA